MLKPLKYSKIVKLMKKGSYQNYNLGLVLNLF
jgi:hypothetical protein